MREAQSRGALTRNPALSTMVRGELLSGCTTTLGQVRPICTDRVLKIDFDDIFPKLFFFVERNDPRNLPAVPNSETSFPNKKLHNILSRPKWDIWHFSPDLDTFFREIQPT